MGSLAHIEAISSLRSERSVKVETTWYSIFVSFLSSMVGLFCEERATREGMDLQLLLRFTDINQMSHPKYVFLFVCFHFFKENVKLSGIETLVRRNILTV